MMCALSCAWHVLDAQPHLRFSSVPEGSEPRAFWEPMAHTPANSHEDAAAEDAAAAAGVGGSPTRALRFGGAAGGGGGGDDGGGGAAAERRMHAEGAQARGWRLAAGAQRAFVWRVRALGYGLTRVAMERTRAGMPLRASLHSHAVLVIDAVVCLFVWVGEEAPEADETLGMQIAQQYAQSAGRAVQVSHVLAGAEPDEFRRIFHG